MITEADTCRRYVLPKLYSAGWNDDQINEQKTFTDGRIIVTGNKCIRQKKKRSDYLLKIRRDFSIAVAEANLLIKILVMVFNRLKNMQKFSVLSSHIPQTVKELLNSVRRDPYAISPL